MQLAIESGRAQNDTVRIVVVGAGPAGAALSLLLVRGGAEVLLLERETDFERVFRGEGLMPLGLEMLHQMGFRERLRELPGDTLDAWDIHLERTRVMHIEEPSRELGDLALRIVSQPALLSSLIDEAKKHPAFAFRPGVSVRDLVRDGERVTGVLLSTPAGEETLAADLVIGTDGRASLVRKRAGLELRLLNESYDVLWFKLPLPDALEGSNPIQTSRRVRTRSWPTGRGTDAGSSPGCFPRAAGAASANAIGWPSVPRCCRSRSPSTCSDTAMRW